MICPYCQGEGIIERVNWNGPYEVPCPHCYESLGEVNAPDDDVRDMRQ
jgi:hypothetical protein